MFRFDWTQFDARLGLIFMVGVVVVFSLMGGSDFPWFAAGTSAMLAWLTILLVPPQTRRRDLLGLSVYLAGGVARHPKEPAIPDYQSLTSRATPRLSPQASREEWPSETIG